MISFLISFPNWMGRGKDRQQLACIRQDRSTAENEEETENWFARNGVSQGNFLGPDHCQPDEGASAPDPPVHRSQIQTVTRSGGSISFDGYFPLLGNRHLRKSTSGARSAEVKQFASAGADIHELDREGQL